MTNFMAFNYGSALLAMWALPCANLVRDVVKLLAGHKQASAHIKPMDVVGVSHMLLTAAGQARPRTL